ncbi:isochorismate synthase, partial [Sarracenia purpurea var. burkii]
MSMNGCRSDPTAPIGTVETRTFPALSTPAMAVDWLRSAVSEMKSHPPPFDSGIIRLEPMRVSPALLGVMPEKYSCVESHCVEHRAKLHFEPSFIAKPRKKQILNRNEPGRSEPELAQ